MQDMKLADLQDITWDDFIQLPKMSRRNGTCHDCPLDPSDLGLARIIMQSAGEWLITVEARHHRVTIKEQRNHSKTGLNVLATLN